MITHKRIILDLLCWQLKHIDATPFIEELYIWWNLRSLCVKVHNGKWMQLNGNVAKRIVTCLFITKKQKGYMTQPACVSTASETFSDTWWLFFLPKILWDTGDEANFCWLACPQPCTQIYCYPANSLDKKRTLAAVLVFALQFSINKQIVGEISFGVYLLWQAFHFLMRQRDQSMVENLWMNPSLRLSHSMYSMQFHCKQDYSIYETTYSRE